MAKKGGYLSWNPLNWFKPKPEEVVPTPPAIVETADTLPTTLGGRKRKTRRARRVKKTRAGKKTIRA